jgi:hypothetical protein
MNRRSYPNMHAVYRQSLLGAVLIPLLLAAPAVAQVPHNQSVYHPLNQRTPPGVAASWAGIAGHITPGYLQPVRVELPEAGTVTFFDGSPARPIHLTAPNQVRLSVGQVHRLRIGDMPSLPGIELYPTIEICDHLHPPYGCIDEYPVPIQFTSEEIQLALDGRLVTKVVYLEQPQLALPGELPTPLPVVTVANTENLVAQADRLGRPLAIVRLGSRVPGRHGPDPAFFGAGARVLVTTTMGEE